MKPRTFLLLPILAFTALVLGNFSMHAADDTNWQAAYGSLLKKYVTGKGVKYKEWHENQADVKALSDVVEAISTQPVPEGRDESLAYYINVYNAWILNNILAKYPTKGPLDGETLFFHGKRIKVAGKKISFDTLEQKIIRPTYQEPRIHFALNCAAISCPPLAREPFEAKKLDKQLDALAKAFTSSKGGAELDKASGKLRVSKIFDWYKDDFVAGGGVIPFINKYGKRGFDPNLKIEVMEYDWSLNEAR